MSDMYLGIIVETFFNRNNGFDFLFRSTTSVTDERHFELRNLKRSLRKMDKKMIFNTRNPFKYHLKCDFLFKCPLRNQFKYKKVYLNTILKKTNSI